MPSSARTWAVFGLVRSLVSWPAQPWDSSLTPAWTCASMNPGRIHFPVASTTSTSSGTAKPGPLMAAILPSRSRTVPPSTASPSIGTTSPPTIAVLTSVTVAASGSGAAVPDRGELLRGQLQAGRRDVLRRVLGGAGAGDGQHLGRAGQQPGQHDLVVAHAEPVGGHGHADVLVRLLNRRPGQEDHVVLLAEVYQGLRLAVGDVVPVLHRDDGHDLLRLVHLGLGDVGDADVPDLALV